MDVVHLHLITNHTPIIGAFLGSVVLTIGMVRKSPPTFAAAYWVFLLSAAVGVVAYFTGEGAEEAVEHLPGVSHNLIETHEYIALFTLGALVLLSLLSLVGLLRSKNHYDKIKTLATVILLTALVAFGIGTYTALTGGQIRHTEVRGNAAAIAQLDTQQNNNH